MTDRPRWGERDTAEHAVRNAYLAGYRRGSLDEEEGIWKPDRAADDYLASDPHWLRRLLSSDGTRWSEYDYEKHVPQWASADLAAMLKRFAETADFDHAFHAVLKEAARRLLDRNSGRGGRDGALP